MRSLIGGANPHRDSTTLFGQFNTETPTKWLTETPNPLGFHDSPLLKAYICATGSTRYINPQPVHLNMIQGLSLLGKGTDAFHHRAKSPARDVRLSLFAGPWRFSSLSCRPSSKEDSMLSTPWTEKREPPKPPPKSGNYLIFLALPLYVRPSADDHFSPTRGL